MVPIGIMVLGFVSSTSGKHQQVGQLRSASASESGAQHAIDEKAIGPVQAALVADGLLQEIKSLIAESKGEPAIRLSGITAKYGTTLRLHLLIRSDCIDVLKNRQLAEGSKKGNKYPYTV